MSKTIEPVSSSFLSANSNSDFRQLSEKNVRAQEDMNNVLLVPKFIGVWRSAKCFLFALADSVLALRTFSLLNLFVTFFISCLPDVVPLGRLPVELEDFNAVD